MIPKKKELEIKRRINICPPPVQSRKNLDGKKKKKCSPITNENEVGKKRKIVHLLQMKMKWEKK
jgi:hypothetical protein